MEANPGFEVLTAVFMNYSVFWDITPCCLLKITLVLEERAISIFRAEEEAKQETCLKQAGSRATSERQLIFSGL
jgi:hypothetical protein